MGARTQAAGPRIEGRAGSAPAAAGARLAPWLALAVALLGSGALAWSLSTYGPSMSQTGLHNAAAAESLLAGEPLETSRGELFTSWPPLMPIVFAGGARLGLSFSEVALVGNVLACFVLLWSVGLLAWRASGSVLAAALAPGFLLACRPLMRSLATTQTEPWFLALVAVGAGCVARYADTRRTGWLFSAAAALALASLQRYVGGVFVACAALFLLGVVRGQPLAARARRSVLFVLGAGLPPLAWMTRNWLRTGRPTGVRDESFSGYARNAADAGSTMLGWFVPQSWPGWAAWILLAVLVTGAVAALRGWTPVARLAALCALVYPAFVVVYGSHVHLDPLRSRLMLPCLPFLVVLVVAGFGGLAVHGGGGARAAGLAGLALLGAVTTAGAPRATDLLVDAHERGLGGIQSKQWSESALVELMRELELSEPVYSNLPELVTYHAGVPAELLGSYGLRRTLRDSRLMAEEGYIVWVTRDGLPALRPGKALELALLAECGDGAVYRTRPARD